MGINWLECPEIEIVPGKMGGQPLIKGHRIRAEDIVDIYESGSTIDDIIKDYYPHISRQTIERILAFYHQHQHQSK